MRRRCSPREQDIKGRHDEQREYRRNRDAVDHHDADGLARLRAGAGAQQQRQSAEGRAGAGHQNGPEADGGRFDNGLAEGQASISQLVREFHNQHAVLG